MLCGKPFDYGRIVNKLDKTSWKTGKSSRSAHSVQLQLKETINGNLQGHVAIIKKSPRVWVEEVAFLQWIGKQAEGALPGAVQQVQGTINPADNKL